MYLTLLNCIQTCIVPRRTTSMDTPFIIYLIKIIRTLLVPRRTFVWTLTLTNTNTLKIITVKMACTPGKN
jgi:hypothetical protein